MQSLDLCTVHIHFNVTLQCLISINLHKIFSTHTVAFYSIHLLLVQILNRKTIRITNIINIPWLHHTTSQHVHRFYHSVLKEDGLQKNRCNNFYVSRHCHTLLYWPFYGQTRYSRFRKTKTLFSTTRRTHRSIYPHHHRASFSWYPSSTSTVHGTLNIAQHSEFNSNPA